MRVFLFGVFGSAAVEVIALYRFYLRYRRFPAHCRNWPYWIVRSMLALIGGGLAFAQHVHTDILAVQIGATAPLLFDAMTHSPTKRDQNESP